MRSIQFLTVFFLFSALTTVSGQTHLWTDQDTDIFYVQLVTPLSATEDGRIRERVNLRIDNNSTNYYSLSGPTPGEGINNGSRYLFGSIAYQEGKPDKTVLIRDRRPYDGYVVDYPLNIHYADAGNYTLDFYWYDDLDNVKTTAVVRLFDAEAPEKGFIHIKNGDTYSFSVPAGKVGTTTNRFVLRMYAACLFKEGVTNGRWDDETNWYGGIPGKNGGNVKVNNCAIIPEGVKVTIPTGSSYTIGSLLNSGEIEIKAGATLGVTYEAKMVSVKDIY